MIYQTVFIYFIFKLKIINIIVNFQKYEMNCAMIKCLMEKQKPRNRRAKFPKLIGNIFYRFLIVYFFLNTSILSMAQVTFNKTYNSGYDGLFNVLPQGTNYWMVMNAHQNPDQSLVCKLDSLGNVILSKSFADTSNSTIIYSLLKDYDSNFISGCYKSNIVTNQSNAFLFKFDVNGDSLWSKTFTDSTGQDLNGNYITLTSDSGYLITGQLWDPVMSVGDYFILKADGVGNFLWSQS